MSSTATTNPSSDPTSPPPAQTSTTAFPPPELQSLLIEVTHLLKQTDTTLCVAETACGGLISATLLAQPGASKIYKGGLTLYTLPSRIAYAGWTEDHITAYRGPTTDIVRGIARHVRRDLEATYCLAESGTAGPTGGATANRTPGYVALAVDAEQGTVVREVQTGLSADRTGNMVAFAREALTLVRDVLAGEATLDSEG